jgi:16S rRNA (uracil1498-N3)-methyltransferase
MSAGRFFVEREIISSADSFSLPVAIAQQVRQVLRLRAGDTITLLDGTGIAYICELQSVARDDVRACVCDRSPLRTEPRVRVSLYQGLLKAAKFEWIVQKGTELGLTRFVPFASAHSISGLEDVSAAKYSRWRSIATEAAEQSERGMVPEISMPMTFAQAVTSDIGDLKLIAWEGVAMGTLAAQTIMETVYTHAETSGMLAAISIVIGPEGGFTSDEIDLACQHGFHVVTLGPRILRAETAALVAVTLALSAAGEMGG